MEENKESTSNKAETTTMEDENLVEFKVVYNKKKYEICFGELCAQISLKTALIATYFGQEGPAGGSFFSPKNQ